MTPDWVEAIGTWVGGLGTVGALIFTGAGLRRETRARREDIKQLKAAELDNRMAQARTVVLHDVSLIKVGTVFDPTRTDGPVIRAVVGNYGDAPTTDLIANLTWTGEDGNLHIAKTPFTAAVLKRDETKNLRWVITDEFDVTWPVGASQEQLMNQLEISMTFTDVHGLRWHRDKYGLLSNASPCGH